MITLSYAELLLTILTLCALLITATLVAAALRTRSTLAQLDRVVARLLETLPELGRLTRDADEVVRQLHELGGTASLIAGDLEAVTSETRRTAVPLIRDLRVQAEGVQSAVRHASAVVAGARAGLAALHRNKT